MRGAISEHPRIFAWIILTAALVGLVFAASVGRELHAWQYFGLSLVALGAAAISVRAVFADDAEPGDGEREL